MNRNSVLSVCLLAAIAFSVITIANAVAPNPGHTWAEVGDVAVTVAQGGTGASTLTANNVILGNGTSPVGFVAPGASGNVLTSNGTTWTSATPTNYRTLITLGADVPSTASTAFQDITGLSFAVTSGTIYRWQATILYTTSAATIGIRVAPNGPAFSQNAYITETVISKTGSATAGWHNGQTALQSGTVSSASISTTGGNLITATGIYKPSANGTFQLQFAPETATANGVVVQDGSTLEWW